MALVLLLDRIALFLLRPPPRPYPRRVSDLPYRHEELDLAVRGHRLHAWLIEPDEPATTLVILVHGWASNSGQMLDVAGPLLDSGRSVLLVDLRSHGRSGGGSEVTIRHYRDDVRTAARWAARRFPERVRVLAGHSLGGGVSAVAVAEGAPAHGVVLMGAPADFLQIWAEYLSERGLPGRWVVRAFSPFWRLRAGVPFAALQPEGRIREVGVPVLVLQGEEDHRVSMEHARRLADAAGRELRIVEGAGHSGMLEAPGLHRQVTAFLDRIEAERAGRG